MTDNGKGKSEHENKYFTMSVIELMEEKQGRRERNSLRKWLCERFPIKCKRNNYYISSKV